jgi:hypothetical protein
VVVDSVELFDGVFVVDDIVDNVFVKLEGGVCNAVVVVVVTVKVVVGNVVDVDVVDVVDDVVVEGDEFCAVTLAKSAHNAAATIIVCAKNRFHPKLVGWTQKKKLQIYFLPTWSN